MNTQSSTIKYNQAVNTTMGLCTLLGMMTGPDDVKNLDVHTLNRTGATMTDCIRILNDVRAAVGIEMERRKEDGKRDGDEATGESESSEGNCCGSCKDRGRSR